jgi:hypothetical protein
MGAQKVLAYEPKPFESKHHFFFKPMMNEGH